MHVSYPYLGGKGMGMLAPRLPGIGLSEFSEFGLEMFRVPLYLEAYTCYKSSEQIRKIL